MEGLAARHAQEADGDPGAGQAVLEQIRAVLARIETLAGQSRRDRRLLALAVLSANEAAAAAETLAERQIPVARLCSQEYARGRADTLAGLTSRDRRLRALRPVT